MEAVEELTADELHPGLEVLGFQGYYCPSGQLCSLVAFLAGAYDNREWIDIALGPAKHLVIHYTLMLHGY